MSRLGSLIRADDGPVATEYAVMLALIIVIAITVISALGRKVSQAFSSVESQI